MSEIGNPYTYCLQRVKSAISGLPWRFAYATHAGGEAENQDSVLLLPFTCGLFVAVTDGLGGIEHGGDASSFLRDELKRIVVSEIEPLYLSPMSTLPDIVNRAEMGMRRHLLKHHSRADARTTLAMAWITDRYVVTGHAGDTRIYRLGWDQVWRTEDHAVEIMQPDGQRRRVLERTLGGGRGRIEMMRMQPLVSGDTLLICSDGVWDHPDWEQEMHRLRDAGTSELRRYLAQRAEQDPRCDNMTLVIINHR